VALFLYYREKMELDLKTILICILPVILILGNVAMTVSFLMLSTVILTTNLIVTREEKLFLGQQMRRFLRHKDIRRGSER